MNRESFFCPITREIMQDPVVDPEGNSYERAAIEAWLNRDQSSPITRSPLHISQLAPNRALKDVIQDELKRSHESGDTQWQQTRQDILGRDEAIAQVLVQTLAELSLQPGQGQVQANTSANASAAAPADPVALAAAAKADEVELVVAASRVNDGEVLLHASVVPGPGVTRSPADVCCVVDISGSMGAEASIKTGSGQEERHGLSLLDIVKHAVKTVVQSLEVNDRFGLVVFSTTARVVFELTAITEASKKTIFTKIDSLEPEDTTNLWDGLHKGLEMLKTSVAGRVSALLMLTDGLPNVTPPRGELAMLKKYKDEHKQLNTTINTFGFGYSIDTPLLVNLAGEGHGMHCFIPDASFVGTAFVNSISNLLVTMGTNVTLSIEPQHGASIQQVLGNFPTQTTQWGAQVNLCSLQYGQTKDLVVRLSVPHSVPYDTEFVNVTLRFDVAKTGTKEEKVAQCSSYDNGGVDLDVCNIRLQFVTAIAFIIELVHSGKDAQAGAALADIQELASKCNDPRAKALLQDITGQVKEAIQRAPEDYFKKWGRHYLPSLARAHLLQQCNNFKDPGIQAYGGTLFQQRRDIIDDIFLKLPPPKPSIRRSAASSGHGRSAPSSMGVYHNAAGPCFAGECLVRMASGVDKRVRDIKKGDVVLGPKGSSEVLCVIKTHCVEGKEDLVIFSNGLQVTPYHPIKDNNKWCFPVELQQLTRDVACEAVYNFVLDNNHTMMIQGVECVTLGHGMSEEGVAHPYFGTRRVVGDLAKMRGWAHGLVELFPAACQGGKCMIRDKQTGLVCGFAASAVVSARDL